MKLRDWLPLILTVVVFGFFTIKDPSSFNLGYLLYSSSLYAEAGLLAIGMTFVICSGSIDLSVGSNLILTACITAKLMEAGVPIPVALGLSLVCGTLFGLINGALVAGLKLPPFLVTVGTMAAFRGAAQALVGPSSVKIPASLKGIDKQTFLFLPIPILLTIVVAVGAWFLLHRTVFGKWVVSTGSSERVSTYSIVPVTRVRLTVFALTGFLAGLGSILLLSRLGVARHDLLPGVELDAITMVVVGGTAIAGGRGTIFGTVSALFLIMVIKTGMGVANIKAEYQLTIIGFILIASVLAQNWDQNRSKRIKYRSDGAVST